MFRKRELWIHWIFLDGDKVWLVAFRMGIPQKLFDLFVFTSIGPVAWDIIW